VVKVFFRFILRCTSGFAEADADSEVSGLEDGESLSNVDSCGSTYYDELAVAMGSNKLTNHNYASVGAVDHYDITSDTTMEEFEASPGTRITGNSTYIQVVPAGGGDVGIDWDDLNRGDNPTNKFTYSSVFDGQEGDLVIDIECDACFDGGARLEQYLTLYRDEGVEEGEVIDHDNDGNSDKKVLYNSWKFAEQSLIDNPQSAGTTEDPHDETNAVVYEDQ